MNVRKLSRAIILAGVMTVMAGAGQGAPDTDRQAKAEWQEWRRDTDADYSTARTAVLKINDSVYLKPGQTAWLLGKRGDPSSYRWSLEPAKSAVLHVKFQGSGDGKFTAEMVQGGQTLDLSSGLKDGFHRVDTDFDFTGRITSVDAGKPRLALKVFNQDHPAAKAFKGLDFFPWSAAFRIEAEYEPEKTPVPEILETKRGLAKRFFRQGHAVFDLEGKTIRMPLYTFSAKTEGIEEFFALFTDETTGKETYGVGRYLDVETEGAYPPKSVLLDFNYAYNPICARSPHFNCPLVEFHIPAAIRAGEKYIKH